MSWVRRHIILLLPFLVAAYPVLEIFADNQNQLPFRELVGPLFVSALVTAIVMGLAWLVLRKSVKASLAASMVMAEGLFYLLWLGRYEESVESLGAGSTLKSSALFIAVVLGLTAAAIIWIARSRRSLRRPAELALVVFTALILLVAYNIGRYNLANRRADATTPASPLAAPSGAVVRTDAPDVYYIILDRYADSKTLQQRYSFDNSSFTAGLASQGFVVANGSYANYPFTIQSLASSLNGEYLPALAARDQTQASSNLLLDRMIQKNGVAKFFTSHGYQYINVGSWWDPTGTNAQANTNLHYMRGITLFGHEFRVSDFGAVVLRQSFLAPILDKKLVVGGKTVFAATVSANQLHHDNALYELNQLNNSVVKMPGPKFVFAHILLPHPPYVFNAAGQPSSDQDLGSDKGYIAQLTYTNKRINELITNLTTQSAKPPVIVLQADEGPYPVRFDGHTDTFNWNSATLEELQEKTGILNAYYLPGVSSSEISADISPVNTFRFIFNHYFGTSLPILPDNHYIDNSWTPYEFIDITSKVGQ